MKRNSFLPGIFLFSTSVLAGNPDSFLSLAAGVLRSLIAVARTRRRRAIDYHDLSHLDDRTLKDIGLSRSDIPSATDLGVATMPAPPFHRYVRLNDADALLLRMRD